MLLAVVERISVALAGSKEEDSLASDWVVACWQLVRSHQPRSAKLTSV